MKLEKWPSGRLGSLRTLAGYEGTLLLVSHDRRVLAARTNRVLELDGSATPHVYPGGYAEYVAVSGHEAPGMTG